MLFITIYTGFICLATQVHRSVEDGSIMEKLRGGLDILCPGVNICGVSSGDGPSYTAYHTPNAGNQPSCCTACSCAEDCSIGTCCFGHTEPDIVLHVQDTGPVPMSQTPIGAEADRTETDRTEHGFSLAEAFNISSGLLRETDTPLTRGAPQSRAVRPNPTKDTREIRKICTYPGSFGSKDVLGEYFNDGQGYYMVMSPPENGCKNVKQEGGDGCSPAKKYPWGTSLFPVYSPETKLIYVNPICAKCHGLIESDFETWEVHYLDTKKPVPDPWLANTYRAFESVLFDNKKLSPEAALIFYPSNYKMLKEEKCIFDLNSDCIDTFEIPTFLNMSRLETLNACKHGPRAPFKAVGQSKYYYNVYCAICRGGNGKLDGCTFDDFDDVNRGVLNLPLSAMLSRAFIEDSLRSDVSDNPVACRTKSSAKSKHGRRKPECRPLRCPKGHIRHKDGSCQPYGITRLVAQYMFTFKLAARKPIRIQDMANPRFQNYLQKKVCHNKFDLMLYYQKPNNGEIGDVSQELLAICKRESEHGLSEFLSIATDVTKRPIRIRLRDEIVVIDVELSKNAKFELGSWQSERTYTLVAAVPTTLENQTNVRFVSISQFVRSESPQIVFTKLYVCEYIILYPDEFVLFDENDAVAVEYNGRVYFTGEFFLDTLNDGQTGAGICVGDTDFIPKTELSMATTMHVSTGCVFVGVTFLAIWHCLEL